MGGPGASVLLRDPLTKQQKAALEIWLHSITNNLEQKNWCDEFWLNETVFLGTVSRCLFCLSLEETTERWENDAARQVKELLGYLPEQSIHVFSNCNQDADHTTLGYFVLHLAQAYNGMIDMEGAITPPAPPLKPADRERLHEWLAQPPERAKERRAYWQTQLKALRNSLPPSKTMQDIFYEQHFDPDSPLKTIQADVEAKFGPDIPPEFGWSENMPSLEDIRAYVRAMPGNVYEIEYTALAGHRWVSHIVDSVFLQAWMKHPNFHMLK